MRKIKAIRKRINGLLYDMAGFWDEGQVTGQIDLTLENLNRDLEAIEDLIDDEVAYQAETADLGDHI